MSKSDAVTARLAQRLVTAIKRDRGHHSEYLRSSPNSRPKYPEYYLDAIPGRVRRPHLVTLLQMFDQSESRRHLPCRRSRRARSAAVPEALSALDALALTLPPPLTASLSAAPVSCDDGVPGRDQVTQKLRLHSAKSRLDRAGVEMVMVSQPHYQLPERGTLLR